MIQTISSKSTAFSQNTAINYPSAATLSEFEIFYDKYAPAFYGEIKKRLYKDEVSQKVMTDAFLKIYSLLNSPIKKNSFIGAMQLVKKEISTAKIDLALNQILYTPMQTKQSPATLVL